MGTLSIHSQQDYLDKQEEMAHAFQIKNTICLNTNGASLPNKTDELRESSTTNNTHLLGISGT